jgi:hypothetical protein
MDTPDQVLGELYQAFIARHGKQYADAVYYIYQARGGFFYIQLPDVIDGKIYPARGTFPRPYRRKQILQLISWLRGEGSQGTEDSMESE